MSGLEDWRSRPRVAVEGEAFWSAGRNEGSCRLRNLSATGVSVTEHDAPLPVGEKLVFTLRISDEELRSVRAEVIRIDPDGLALRFVDLSDEQQDAIARLIRESVEAGG